MEREAVDGPQVLGGQPVGRAELDLRLHVGQVDLGGQRSGAVVALFGLLDEGVWRASAERTREGSRSGWNAKVSEEGGVERPRRDL